MLYYLLSMTSLENCGRWSATYFWTRCFNTLFIFNSSRYIGGQMICSCQVYSVFANIWFLMIYTIMIFHFKWIICPSLLFGIDLLCGLLYSLFSEWMPFFEVCLLIFAIKCLIRVFFLKKKNQMIQVCCWFSNVSWSSFPGSSMEVA